MRRLGSLLCINYDSITPLTTVRTAVVLPELAAREEEEHKKKKKEEARMIINGRYIRSQATFVRKRAFIGESVDFRWRIAGVHF